MKSIKIKSLVREATGKTSTKSVRKDGLVPCVLYGGDQVLHFTATEIGFKDLVYTAAAHTVVLDFGDDKKNAILQDIQFHPLTDRIIHIDFLQVFDDKEVTVSIPVNFIGTPIGVRNGGNLLVRKRAIRTRAIPANLPDAIDINIEELKIGKFLYIGDIRDERYTFLAGDKSVIVGVKTARGAVEDEEEEEEGTEEGAAEGGDAPAAPAEPAAE